MSTTDEQLKKDFTKGEIVLFIFLCVVSIAGIIDGLFIHLLKIASEKIVLSGGLALSFYSVYLMIKSKKLKQNDIEFNSHAPLTPKRYKWGNRGVLIGFVFQFIGIWLSSFRVSSAIASNPVVENLTETEIISFLDKISEDPELIVAGLALLATILIAIASWLSVRLTKRTTQSQLYIKFFEEYASENMKDALKELNRVKELKEWNSLVNEYPEDISKLETALISKELIGDSTKRDIRYIKYYFIKALRLKNMGYISKIKYRRQHDYINYYYEHKEKFEMKYLNKNKGIKEIFLKRRSNSRTQF